jgi:glycosyltransferase involved in cell wall biosynthesis
MLPASQTRSPERPSSGWPSLSIVVPVYNSSLTLRELVERLTAVLSPRSDRFEIILVNDGSRDDSWAVIRELCRQHAGVRGIDLMRNYGQHNALLCGIRLATNDVVVTMDDDLQHPPEELPTLIATLLDGHDVVFGVPAAEQHGLMRDLASQLTKLALRSAMGAEIARSVSAFRVFRRSVTSAFAAYHGTFVSIDVLLTWGTTRFGSVRVRHDPRRRGRSGYTFRKLLTHALNMTTGFSVVPLQIASVVGFTLTLVGLVLLAFVLARYLVSGSVVPGFPFLASVVTIFSGAQMFALGIIGEYLARMHFMILDRPSYVVREETTSARSETCV